VQPIHAIHPTLAIRRAIPLGLLSVLLFVGPAGAEAPRDPVPPGDQADSQGETQPAPPPIGLDQLLRLPSDMQYDVERKGGIERGEWRERFRKAIGERDDAAKALQESRDQLSEMAAQTDGWNLGAPGTSGSVDPDAPLSFELKQRIRRQRRELDEAKERLRALEVQANLAGIPADWRDPGPDPGEKTSEVSFEP